MYFFFNFLKADYRCSNCCSFRLAQRPAWRHHSYAIAKGVARWDRLRYFWLSNWHACYWSKGPQSWWHFYKMESAQCRGKDHRSLLSRRYSNSGASSTSSRRARWFFIFGWLHRICARPGFDKRSRSLRHRAGFSQGWRNHRRPLLVICWHVLLLWQKWLSNRQDRLASAPATRLVRPSGPGLKKSKLTISCRFIA